MSSDILNCKKSASTALSSISFFVLTLFFFSPARIYIGNFMEFSYLFHDSMLFFFIVSFSLIMILFTVVSFSSLHLQAYRIIVSIFFVSAFLAWFQGNIILWQYGVLDGRDIEWSALIHYGIIDSIFWAVLIAVSIVKIDLIFRISRFISLVFIIIQLLSVSQLWISMPKDQSFKQQESGTDGLFLFSENRNVIILVLDTFQSDIFQDIILEDDNLRASFDGFTYFRNSLAGSDATAVSIPNILTAVNYDNTIPYLDFVKKAFLDNSLPKILKEYGFTIDLYPIAKYSVYDNLSGVALSKKKLWDWNSFFKEQAFITDLALFRSSPHFIKELIYNRQKWFISGLIERYQDAENFDDASKNGERESVQSFNSKYAKEYRNSGKLIGKNRDAGFINRMIPLSKTNKNMNAFKFFQLNGIHTALVMNEELEYEVMDPDRAGMKRQGIGILKLAAMFLERLKQLKIFDNSLIFIIGDHGSGLSDAGINASPYGENLNKSGPYRGFFRNFKSAGIPLILVKRIDSRGELLISNAPVSLSDIPQTVVEELELDANFPGKSMFKVEENEKRERIYRAFIGSQEDIEYLAPLYEYCVNGFSWDDKNWRETGNVFYAKSK